jgi:hypothetical protein
MLAHEPGKRYQTTSELIVDLERSSLAAAVPSFVDPDVALKDPLVQARLTTVPAPTQFDLGRRSAVQSAPAEDPEIWYLRHRNKEGRWRKARASTKQIKERLQLGRMPPSVEASHDPKGEYRLLETYVEFRQLNGTPTEPTEPERDGSKETPPSQEENDARLKPTPARRRQLLWLLPVGLILFITVAVLTYYLTP